MAASAPEMRLMLGDCLERMMEIKDQSVDLVLCDLPYGTTQNSWDSVLPLDRLWAHYWRVCRGAVVLTATQPFSSALVMSAAAHFHHEWIWRKDAATGHLNAKRMPMREHEVCLVFRPVVYNPQGLLAFNKKVRRGSNGTNFGRSKTENMQEFTNYPRSIIEVGRDGKVHPTQKPVALMEYMIRTYTDPGATVLDNCMGSGTTGVAALSCGRRFVGIERDPGYFAIAERRIRGCDAYEILCGGA